MQPAVQVNVSQPADLAAVRRRYVARRARVTERVAELIVELAFGSKEARP